jgi:hypothetical protein
VVVVSLRSASERTSASWTGRLSEATALLHCAVPTSVSTDRSIEFDINPHPISELHHGVLGESFSTSSSPERKKSRKLTPLYLHVSSTLSKTK